MTKVNSFKRKNKRIRSVKRKIKRKNKSIDKNGSKNVYPEIATHYQLESHFGERNKKMSLYKRFSKLFH